METDFKQIASCIRKGQYKYIGAGSGRLVFDMGNRYVVKVARNAKGIAQNRAEYDIAYKADSALFTRILQASENFELIIAEKAEKIKNLSFVWDYFHVKNNHELFQLQEFKDLSIKYDLLMYDFGRLVNWGRINDRPVIVDYGFTRKVHKKFYRHIKIME